MADPERTLRAGGGVDGTGIRGGRRTNGDAGWTGRGEASRAGLGTSWGRKVGGREVELMGYTRQSRETLTRPSRSESRRRGVCGLESRVVACRKPSKYLPISGPVTLGTLYRTGKTDVNYRAILGQVYVRFRQGCCKVSPEPLRRSGRNARPSPRQRGAVRPGNRGLRRPSGQGDRRGWLLELDGWLDTQACGGQPRRRTGARVRVLLPGGLIERQGTIAALTSSRRSWRIGQTRPVKVVFMVYRSSLRAAALKLVAKQLQSSLAVEGELPECLRDGAT